MSKKTKNAKTEAKNTVTDRTENANSASTETPAAEEAPKQHQPAHLQGNRADGKPSKAPHLTCTVTGRTRYTSMEYLGQKAKNFDTDVETICKFYAAKDIVARMRKGDSVADIRKGCSEDALKDLDPTDKFDEARVKEIIRLNSKRRKAKPEASENKEEQKEETAEPATA